MPSVAPQTTTEPSAATTTESPAWRSHLQEQYGIDGSRFSDETQALDYTLRGFMALQQQAAEQEAQYQAQIAQLRQAQQQPIAPVAPAPQPAPQGKWNPPEYDARWNRLLQMNQATGLYEPLVPGSVNPEIVQKANARAEWERKWQSEFQDNPFEFMNKGLEDKFKAAEEAAYKRAVEYFQSQQNQATIQTTVKSTIDNHKEWLYQKDAMGGLGFDAAGRPLLTAKGQQYAQAVEQLARSGVQDPVVQNEIALQMIGHQAQAAQPANRITQFAGAPAARNFAEALHTGSRNGSSQPVVAGAIAPSTTPGSFLAMAEQTMREQGMSLSGGSVSPV